MPQQLNELVSAEIRAWMGRRHLSAAQVANDLGVGGPWMSRRMRGAKAWSLVELEQVAGVLDVPVTKLLPAPPAA